MPRMLLRVLPPPALLLAAAILATPLATPAAAARAQAAPANLPAALDRVPTDAAIAVAVPSIARLDGELTDLLKAAELTTVSRLSEVLAVIGLRDGLDLDRSAAFAVFLREAPADDGPATPTVVALLPSAGEAKLLDDLRAEPADDRGVRTFTFNGVPYAGRLIGDGFVAIGADAEALLRFDFAPGHNTERVDRLGERSRALLDASPLFAMIEPEPTRAMIDAAAQRAERAIDAALESETGAADGSADAPQTDNGTAPDDAATMYTQTLAGVLRSAIDGATIVTFGMTPGPLGVQLQLVSEQAEPLSPAGAAAAAPPPTTAPTAPPLAELPMPIDQAPWLIAMGAHTSSPFARQMVGAFLGAGAFDADAQNPDAQEPDAASNGPDPIADALAGVRTAAMVIEAPPGPLIGGEPPYAIAVWRAEADRMTEDVHAALRSAFDDAEYIENADRLGRIPLDAWRFRPEPAARPTGSNAPEDADDDPTGDQEGAPEPAGPSAGAALLSVFAMSGEASGFIAIDGPATGGRVLATTVQRKPAIGRAVSHDPASADRPSLADEPMIALVRRQFLPNPPAMEAYVNARVLIERIRPFVGFANIRLDAPQRMGPIGLAVAFDERAVHAGVFVDAVMVRNLWRLVDASGVLSP